MDRTRAAGISRADELVCVFVGGALGTAARWAVEEALPARDGAWPAGTFAVNVLGALLLGVLVEGFARIGDDAPARRRLRLVATTGFCGAFTTYSAFALEVSLLGRGGHLGLAAVYAVASVAVGVVAVMLGVWAARRFAPRSAGDEGEDRR